MFRRVRRQRVDERRGLAPHLREPRRRVVADGRGAQEVHDLAPDLPDDFRGEGHVRDERVRLGLDQVRHIRRDVVARAHVLAHRYIEKLRRFQAPMTLAEGLDRVDLFLTMLAPHIPRDALHVGR